MSLPPNTVTLPISGNGVITAAQHWSNIGASNINIPPIKEHIIQGQMITVSHEIDNIYFEDNMVDVDQIKSMLAAKLAEQLWKSGYMEFTKKENFAYSKKIFHARIFAVPDDTVRILRETGR